MKILAVDTATERCSVALLDDARIIERAVETPRGHAELILPMVDEVLRESGMKLVDVDAIAFGRGPGAFTGVRIGVGVAQGLAFGADKPLVGISNLAAVAAGADATGEILVCMDARMGEVYWCTFTKTTHGMVATRPELVARPEAVTVPATDVSIALGTGFAAYPQLADTFGAVAPRSALPHARDIARLAVTDVRAGKVVAAHEALPVYLRDQVVAVP